MLMKDNKTNGGAGMGNADDSMEAIVGIIETPQILMPTPDVALPVKSQHQPPQ